MMWKVRCFATMALPNEYQLTFSQYTNDKTMFSAIETRFGGNEATKKTQKTLLKQQYENFSASSTESLDSIFKLLQKDFSHEWKYLVVSGMFKGKIETMSIDDLYNNFKIVEQSVKKSVGASSGAQNLAFMTAPSTSNTNDVNPYASFSNNVVYAFMVENPNGSNLLQQDLKQIHKDDLEAMGLKWQLSLLSMREKRYFQRTSKKIFINANDTAGYDKSKVECFNCHKMGHFSRECRAPRNKEGQFRNQDNTRKHGNNEDTSSKAMLAIDGGKPLMDDKGFVDSGCSRHMTGNIAYLSDFKEFDGGYVTFGGGAHGGRISSKGTLKTDSLNFEDVYFVNEPHTLLGGIGVSQMCDKKNYVLFTDTECLILSPNFKLPDQTQILLKISRKDNMYSFDMKNIVPKESLTCLVAKATLDKSMLWHRRLGHINFKNINNLVKDNLVRGLPIKRFENDQTCVACLKGKQHRASCKSKVLNPITKPLFMLHMDLFGPTFDETSEILKNFIKEIEKLSGNMDKWNIIRIGFLVVKPHNKTPFDFLEDEPEVDLGNITNSYTVPPTQNTRIHKDHPITNVIGDVKSSIQTRGMTKSTSEQGFLTSKALTDHSWVEAMQEELLQFKLQQVWILVDLPIGKRAIRTKWVFRNKKDERGIMIMNKTRVHSYMELLRKRFMLLNYQDLKILTIQTKFTRWSRHFMGYIKHQEHVYVDDTIFGFTNKELCTGFEKLMKDKFQMSSMGELTFFLGLQVQQKKDGIFISQDKYVDDILKKFNYTDVKSASTLVDLEKPLVKDEDANNVDCKKQTVVATSTTEAEYVVAASCYGQHKVSTAVPLCCAIAYVDAVGLLLARHSGIPTDSQQTPITTQPPSSRPQKKQSRRKQRKETEVPQVETHHDDSVPIPSNDPLLSVGEKEEQSAKVDERESQCEVNSEQQHHLPQASQLQRTKDKGKEKLIKPKLTLDEEMSRNLEGSVASCVGKLIEEKRDYKEKKDQEISRKKDESSSKKAEITQDSSAKRAGDKLESDKADGVPKEDPLPSSMIRMLQGIDREDLQTLWKLVKTKHGDTRPGDEHERVLWGDLKVMFEPDIKSDLWKKSTRIQSDCLEVV
ncbi:putative ribonuclease H-like domain-containing protein [Tanacetum coccineum]|uniref:Ribonuclease H-like domain-containing protein n=1 Tax=Tanacetum coccineum TaxID=301880 RepID=A0ABQ4YPM4_9ASTR